MKHWYIIRKEDSKVASAPNADTEEVYSALCARFKSLRRRLVNEIFTNELEYAINVWRRDLLRAQISNPKLKERLEKLTETILENYPEPKQQKKSA
ncbi:MAG: hypothetical protein KW793_04840 [Candidatus Doudnabacteria bacterium]|nr:hypothetical protein [Candidatus Doudnabacteria bacterium]